MGKTRLYVGNLPSGVRERDIEDIFHKYGKIANLDLRTNKGPPFAFLDFDDSSAAKDAISGRDGYDCKGRKIRVEYSHGDRDGDRRGGGGGGGYSDRRGYGDRNGDRGYGGGGGGGGGRRDGGGAGLRRSKYRIVITGLPRSGSWQDLKDHFREAGDVCFADVTKDGMGHVEFFREDDMKYALKKLDDTKFRARDGETGYIRIKADDGSSSSSRRRSRSASGDRDRRTRSRSPVSRPARGGDSGEEANGKERSIAKRERSSSRSPKRTRRATRSRSPVTRTARGGASPADNANGKSRRSRSPVAKTTRGSASPEEANGKGGAKRERSVSHSPEHSKSRSVSKSADESRSPSHDRE